MATQQPNHFAQARNILASSPDVAALWRDWLKQERKPEGTPPIPSLWVRFTKWAKGTRGVDVNSAFSSQDAALCRVPENQTPEDCLTPWLDGPPSQIAAESATSEWKHDFTQVDALGSAFAQLLQTYVRAVAREEARALIAQALELQPEDINL